LSIIVAQHLSIKSFGFDLQFPAQKLRPIGLEKTEIAENFSQIGFYEISPGLLKVGGYKANKKKDLTSGVLLILIFRVTKTPIKANEFRIVATYDDIRSDAIKTESILKKSKEERKLLEKYPAKMRMKKHR